jgi:hypothetical protein
MNDVRTIVCLANSRKPPSGRCVAGKEFNGGRFGEWIRPVSNRPTHEISEEERRYENGRGPRLLDVIEIPVNWPKPIGHQTENIEIDADYYWEKTGEVTWNDLRAALDQPTDLWGTGSSTYHGTNDRVAADDAATFTNSLVLIQPQELRIGVSSESGYQGPSRRRVRGIFRYNDAWYSLVVTDPVAEQTLLARPDGEVNTQNTYLTISLSEPMYSYCFKLVAAIIGRDPL